MPPITVMVKPVSGACNMRCRYCFYADEMKRRNTSLHPPMDDQTMRSAVRRCMAYADEQITFVFQGGEPALAGADYYRRFIHLVREYNARKLSVHYAFQTNGYDLSDDMIALLAQEHFLVGVSLDGTEWIHNQFRTDASNCGTYAQVRQTIGRLDQAGVSYNILCVITSAAAQQAEEVLDALSAFPYLQFIPCMDELDGRIGSYSLTNEGYAHFLKHAFLRYERAWRDGRAFSIRQFDNWISMLLGYPPENCAMNGQCSLNFLIESSGDVFPCDFYALDEWRLGNVNHQSLRQMRRSPEADRFCAADPLPERCLACRWYPLCRNGCRRERDASGLYRLCEGTRIFLDEYGSRLEAIAHSIRSAR